MRAKAASSPSIDATAPAIEFAGLKAQYAQLKAAIDAAIQSVLDHGQFIMGPEVAALEQALSDFVGCKHAVAVASGTDALLAALMAEGIGPGDAVFVPAFTFTASAEVIALLGATPVFVDVDVHSYNIDPADLAHRIDVVRSSGRLTPRAVIAVDLFGQPADYIKLLAIAVREEMFLLADAAQSFGAARSGTPVGQLAPVTTTSFFPAKPLGCYGDGGAIFTDDDARAERLRSIRLHGKGTAKYDIVRVGLNARLDTLQAAVLLAKLTAFPAELAARRALARRYDRLLGDIAAIPRQDVESDSSWAQYSILVDDRDKIASLLKDAEIPTAIYYPRPMHMQPAFAHYGGGEGSMPISEELCRRILSLPMNPYLSETEVERICEAVEVAVHTARAG